MKQKLQTEGRVIVMSALQGKYSACVYDAILISEKSIVYIFQHSKNDCK